MGVTEAECHTVKMAWDPQYRDQSRNTIMNEKAAR